MQRAALLFAGRPFAMFTLVITSTLVIAFRHALVFHFALQFPSNVPFSAFSIVIRFIFVL